MTKLEIVGIHGADGLIYVNRLKKGVELIKSDETEYIILLGFPGWYGLNYIKRKFDISERRVLVEGYAKSTLQELKYLKSRFIRDYYKKLGLVSQKWHLYPRIEMLSNYFFPRNYYSVEFFEAEDGRDEFSIKRDIKREKIAILLNKLRIHSGIIGTSDAVEDILWLIKKLYKI